MPTNKKQMFNPPTWATPWTLTTVQESNDKGSWFNFAVTQGDMTEVPMDVLQEAKQMYQDFKAGDIKTSAATSDEMRSANPSDGDDVPF